MLELSKSFLNEVRAFFRFRGKRETEFFFEFARLLVAKFYVT
jgi:hypothetical protein